jgi:hypothetical protein
MKRAGDNDKSGSDQDLKKVRAVEDSDAGAGEDTFFTELNHHIKLVCETEFDFDGATNLRGIQANYNHLKERLSAGASASDFSFVLSRVTDVAQLALDKLDSWSIVEIKAYINSLCSSNSINHSGVETKEELERLLTRFWLCNPERMPDSRAMMR